MSLYFQKCAGSSARINLYSFLQFVRGLYLAYPAFCSYLGLIICARANDLSVSFGALSVDSCKNQLIAWPCIYRSICILCQHDGSEGCSNHGFLLVSLDLIQSYFKVFHVVKGNYAFAGYFL